VHLKDKVIAITGAAQGIGQAIALDLAAAGAKLALIDMNADALANTRLECMALGMTAHTLVADVADEAMVINMMAAIAETFGRLDVVVNNAGITRDALLIKVDANGDLLTKMSLEQWRQVIDINLTGVFLCGREGAAWMAKFGNGGAIVNISSVSRHGNAGQSNYSAAKAGVAAMTVVWAQELARHGIRTGAVAPGFVQTPILSSMRDDVLQKVLAPVPLRRLAEPVEIAQAVRFIIENDFFTGRCLDFDGGLRM
jgi:3-oxoacyl-[acyl-carrier protein] reductase